MASAHAFASGAGARRRSAQVVGLFVLATGLAVPASPQHQDHSAGGSWIPEAVLTKRIPLRVGIGRVSDHITTSSPTAQEYYNQGLAYLYSFVWVDAIRSFHEVLRLDPAAAMAYVGMSRAYMNLEALEDARRHLHDAQALASAATDRERRLIDIQAKQLDVLSSPSDTTTREALKNALDDALSRDDHDSQLWLLRGDAEAQGSDVAAVAFYQAALARDPDNFAAHHLLIHTYESIGNIELALKHGEAFARLAPAVPHAHHMYGHNLRRAGRVGEAIEQFEEARDLERRYYEGDGVPPEFDWHHSHNLNLLATAYLHEGRIESAEAIMREADALPSVNRQADFFKKDLAEFLLSRGRDVEALDSARRLAASRWPLPRIVGNALAGEAWLALGKPAAAGEALAAADAEMQAQKGEPRSVLPYVMALRGEILVRAGRTADGSKVLREVVQRVRAATGPDAWSQALVRLEILARFARQAGDWELAGDVANRMIEHDPYYAGSHFALALVAQHLGHDALARAEFVLAERYWSKADRDLPELVLTRSAR